MDEEIRVLIHFGRSYEYYRGGLYEPHCVGTHVHSHQELVAYVGLPGSGSPAGTDEGRWFFCSVNDWALKFKPAWQEPPARVGPIQTIDIQQKGNPW